MIAVFVAVFNVGGLRLAVIVIVLLCGKRYGAWAAEKCKSQDC